MMAWKFNQKESKKALAHMVIVDELPFSFVEREGFRHYSKINRPGVDIGKRVEYCVNEWGIDAIMVVSVDNASANDSAIDFLRKTFAKKDNCLLIGKWIHIRCAAHILNLVVQDVAQAYEDGFDRYDLEDAAFGNVILKKGLLVPTHKDWDKARKLCGFLKIFYDVTLRILGTKYVTSHMLIVELSTIRELLRKQILCDVLNIPFEDEILYKIAKIVVDDHYGAKGLAIVELKKIYIHAQFKALYEDYVRIHSLQSNSSSVLGKHSDDTTTKPPTRDRLRDKMKSSSTSTSTISELDRYLCKSVEAFDSNVKFDILAWWKVNSLRFPILSLMARDLLAIFVSTVAFELVFSTSERVLDTFRSSLSDKSIESLICTQDWLHKDKDKDKIMEKQEDSETIIIDSSEDDCTSSKRDINEDQSFSY
nr:zinc finger BED domain-containing protein RICESLEEPER 2-like [Tanacetum cinerariifolium]